MISLSLRSGLWGRKDSGASPFDKVESRRASVVRGCRDLAWVADLCDANSNAGGAPSLGTLMAQGRSVWCSPDFFGGHFSVAAGGRIHRLYLPIL